MKYITIIFIITILVALFSAFLMFLKGGNRKSSEKMLKSLKIRVGLSVFLFILLMLAGYMGWIQPHYISQFNK